LFDWELRAALDNAAIMTMGNLVVGVWTGEPNIVACNAMADVYRGLYQRFPDGFAICVIVENAVPLPDETVRAALSSLQKEIQSRVAVMCGVQEATGFRGAAIRSVLTALTIMTRVSYKNATVQSVAEAGPILAPYTVPPLKSPQIVSAIAQFRASIPERRRPDR
jgi:hypothetical protein